MSYNLGQTVELVFTVTPDETPTLTVTAPDGTVSTPVVAGSAGSYTALVEANQTGTWTFVWSTPNGGDQRGSFEVATAVVGLAQARAEINAASSLSDAQLGRIIGAVTRHIERYLGGALTPKVVVETLRGRLLSKYPVLSVTSVDSSGSLLTDWTLDREAGLLDTGSYGPSVVTYVAGYDPIPDDIVQAAIYAIQHAAESHQGAVPVSFQSGVDESFVTSRGFFLPSRSKELLDPYRSPSSIA